MDLNTQLFRKTWDSPTFTSWSAKASQSLKLVLVTPLLLRNFTELEIASWFLFASINYFGNVFVEKTNLVLMRMVALASGGSYKVDDRSKTNTNSQNTTVSDHSANQKSGESEGAPSIKENWEEIGEIYSTSGTFFVVASLFFLAAGAAIGYFSLEPLLQGSSEASRVWGAFFVVLLGDTLVKVFQHYVVLLKGLNLVALVNRWDTILSVVSVLVASVVLSLGADIFELALAYQIVAVVGILRLLLIVRFGPIEGTRYLKSYGWSSEVARSAVNPLVKSAATNLATEGSGRFAIIMLARTQTPAVVAGVLLLIRLLESLASVSQAPVGSHMPGLAKLYRSGEKDHFQRKFKACIRTACSLFSGSIVCLVLLGPLALSIVGSNVKLPSFGVLASLSFGFYWLFTIKIGLSVHATLNLYPAVRRMVFAGLFVLSFSFFLIPELGVYGYLASLYLPFAFCLGRFPWVLGSGILGLTPMSFYKNCFLIPLATLCVGLLLGMFTDTYAK